MAAAVVWIGLEMLRRYGQLLIRVEALERRIAAGDLRPGTVAPEFSLPDLDGATVGLKEMRGFGKPVVLLFTDPQCGPCAQLLPDVSRWQQEYKDRATFALISRRDRAANRTMAAEHAIAHVLVQRDYEVAEQYGARGTPSAVIVSPDGLIGAPVAAGAEGIRQLVARALATNEVRTT
jgi:peroxiredoxin